MIGGEGLGGDGGFSFDMGSERFEDWELLDEEDGSTEEDEGSGGGDGEGWGVGSGTWHYPKSALSTKFSPSMHVRQNVAESLHWTHGEIQATHLASFESKKNPGLQTEGGLSTHL